MKNNNYWSKFAQEFENKNNYVVGKSEMSIFLKLVSEQTELKTTLELGCGNGTYSKVLANNTNKLLATDYSDEMLNVAKYELESFPNVIVEKANCFDLQYSDNSFDTVFMANLLHIIPNPEKAVTESKRVLKHNGKIIILDIGLEGMTFLNKLNLIYRYRKTYGKPSKNRQNLTVSKIQKLLESKGFKTVEAKLIGKKSKAVFVTATKTNF